MKQVKTQDAVGMVLAHDHTQIIVEKFKGVRFPKGHIIKEEDIPIMLEMGKETIFVFELQPGILHEDDAAIILRDLCMGQNLQASSPQEGKIELFAECDGLLTIDTQKLFQLNMAEHVVISARENNIPVHVGDKVAAMRVVPLVIEESRLSALQAAIEPGVFNVHAYRNMTAAILVTGSEVQTGRIKDTFSPVVIQRLTNFPVETKIVREVGDDPDEIKNAILEAYQAGIDIIFCTGGMSVDPDDHTPGAIQNAGAKPVTYGTPVFPGAMFMLAYFDDDVAVMGLPGGVMFSKKSILDVVLPHVVAGHRLTKSDFANMAIGGLLS
jgi:molybdenum cofactor synthesis domain-containing protein